MAWHRNLWPPRRLGGLRILKLTDEFCFGVLDQETGKIVARSREGYLAGDKARALNRKSSWTKREIPDAQGRMVFVKELGERYGVTMKQD